MLGFARSGVLHVLDDQEGSAEIHKSTDLVVALKQVHQHFDELVLAVVRVDEVLVLLHDFEALLELHLSVLLRHEGAELVEVARRDRDHLLFAHVTLCVAGRQWLRLRLGLAQ